MGDEPRDPANGLGSGSGIRLPKAMPLASGESDHTAVASSVVASNLIPPRMRRIDASAKAPAESLAPTAASPTSTPTLPSWLVSLCVHLALILVLGLLYLPLENPPPLSLTARLSDEELEPLDERFVDMASPADELDVTEPTDELFAVESEALAEPIDAAALSELAIEAPMVEMTSLTPTGLLESLAGPGEFSAGGFDARGEASRARMVRRGGGTTSSEKSVEESLNWLARHQHADGTWSFAHRHEECGPECDQPGSLVTGVKGATGLALLPFLGAGHTPREGRHERVVARGIGALVMMMEPTRYGGSFVDGGDMYSHGIASMALCEAYAMTGDERLRGPAQAALNFICYAQDPDGGGWRYKPRQRGDTSVMGWQVGALKSGYLADLLVPPVVPAKASYFLDSVQLDGGETYSYEPDPAKFRPATTAIGLLCRMYLGADRDNEVLARGVERLAKTGPSKKDAYFNYYATQVIFQYTSGRGDVWKKWNAVMRDMLVAGQLTQGEASGSWAPQEGDHGRAKGGRLYATALNCMTLEVYYRLLPIYQTKAFDDGFEE